MSDSPKRVLLATNNPGKVVEMKALLADLTGIELVTPASLNLDLEVEENGATYAENARLKATAFAAASGLPALADDSGLEVEVLGGAPGLLSNRYFAGADTDAKRRAALLARLAKEPRPWRATFRSTVCLALPDGREHFAEGECAGEISSQERGEGGFGYDRIFVIDGLGRTMAEIGMAEKNKLSHRARAVEKLKRVITEVALANL